MISAKGIKKNVKSNVTKGAEAYWETYEDVVILEWMML